MKWEYGMEKSGLISRVGKHVIYAYEEEGNMHTMDIWCEENSVVEPIH